MEMGEVGYSASVFKTFLFTENLNLVNPDYTEESIIADFDRHITASFNEDDIIVDLKDYDKNILVFLKNIFTHRIKVSHSSLRAMLTLSILCQRVDIMLIQLE